MLNRRTPTRHVLLAEDDEDDSILFKEALNELSDEIQLNRVKDGEELMKFLNNRISDLPDVLFLDINMPRKNGFECLMEIKKAQQLSTLPVVVFSTSSGKELVIKMYDAGADLYVCKPNTFNRLKKIIQHAVSINWSSKVTQPNFENFILDI